MSYAMLSPSSRIRSVAPTWDAMKIIETPVQEGRIEVEWLPMDEIIVMESSCDAATPFVCG